MRNIVLVMLLMLFSHSAMATYDEYSSTIVRAAEYVGVEPVLLVAIAHKETRFQNVRAGAGGSAEGLFQFTDQTWGHMLKHFANEFEIALDASKYDPWSNAVMAAVYVRENTVRLKQLLRRNPTPGEIYMSHLLGPTGVRTLLTANLSADASRVLGYAFKRNQRLFLTSEGKRRTVGQFRDSMNWKFQQIVDDYHDRVQDTIAMVRYEDRLAQYDSCMSTAAGGVLKAITKPLMESLGVGGILLNDGLGNATNAVWSKACSGDNLVSITVAKLMPDSAVGLMDNLQTNLRGLYAMN